jgi:hypothetical protein
MNKEIDTVEDDGSLLSRLLVRGNNLLSSGYSKQPLGREVWRVAIKHIEEAQLSGSHDFNLHCAL